MSYSSTKFNIAGIEQNVLQGNNRQELLNGSQYEDQLIEMIKH